MKRTVAARKNPKGQVLHDTSNATTGTPRQGASSSEEEEVIKRHRVVQQRKSFIENEKRLQQLDDGSEATPKPGPSGGRGEKRKSGTAGLGSGLDSSGSGNSDTENQRRKNKRFRRRLSKKLGLSVSRLSNVSVLNSSYGNLNITTGSPAGSPARQPTDKKTLQEIYSTCSALFQAHKITPQNAFSLKLVECLDEIIESDDFDRRNLPLLARTLEIGGKIYVCRVDCTHAHTIKLATEIAQNQPDQAQGDGGDGMAELQDEAGDNDEGVGAEQRKKNRARTKKRSRFIEDNDSKLNTGFEDQSSKYATRRTSLKLKFHRNIDEELDFDYLSYFLKPGEANPVECAEESEALATEGFVPESHVNADEMKDIPWLPFNLMSDWNPTKFDLWGVPLANTNPMEISDIERPPSANAQEAPPDDEFAYNPENRPNEYPEPLKGLPDDSFRGHDGFDDDHFEEHPAPKGNLDASKPLSLENLRSLDDLRKFFAALKGNQLKIKHKYGWAGPVFLKPQRTHAPKPTVGKEAKPKKKKVVVVLNYDEVNWKDPRNRYLTVDSSKTTLDAKTLEKWSSNKTVTPYCNSCNFMGYDDDEEEFRSPFTEDADDLMANITRFFVDANRNIFKLMEEEFRSGKDVLSQSILGPGAKNIDDELPEPEFDIEAPRDYSDDSVGEMMPPVPDAENGPLGGAFDEFAAAGFDLSAMFPGSQGFSTNPMSKASEFESVKFAKQPKPIDMHALKRFIRKILVEKLQLDQEGRPTMEQQTQLDLITLITELMKRVDARMAKHMSVAIVVVGLMHVVADNKLFMEGGGDNPVIVCRGTLWNHRDHIPFNVEQNLDEIV